MFLPRLELMRLSPTRGLMRRTPAQRILAKHRHTAERPVRHVGATAQLHGQPSPIAANANLEPYFSPKRAIAHLLGLDAHDLRCDGRSSASFVNKSPQCCLPSQVARRRVL